MTDFERINGPRVQKIIDMLEVINKSARSQRVGEAQIASLLSPIAQRMIDVEYGDTPVEDEPSPQPSAPSKGTPKEPLYITIKRTAEDAPLADLTYAMAVYVNRIDEHLKQPKGT